MTQRSAFLDSLVLDSGSELHSLAYFSEWMARQREAVTVRIEKIPFSDLRQWHFDEVTGDLCHDSGKFFSIRGIEVRTNFGGRPAWQQPIIDQPEIGFLGIIAKKINGTLHFLMQAKIEPGNINFVQLSPTLQATKSNYTQVHGGNKPLYLEYFNGTSSHRPQVLIDQLQSEQGARFLKKRNRNIIIEVQDDIPVHDNFIWLTLGQIKRLITYDNVVNMDTRTVLSSISYGNVQDYSWRDAVRFTCALDEAMLLSALDPTKAVHELDHLISWITDLKSYYELSVADVPLRNVEGWEKDDYSIFHHERKYFSINAVEVAIGNREVQNWTQPIVESAQEGLIGFIAKRFNGVYHFLVQAKVEAGNFDILEIAPTVQCLTGNYRNGKNEYDVLFVNDVLNATPEQTIHRSMQSEEGGRFYQEQNLNIVVDAGPDFPAYELPPTFKWMTAGQLMEFTRYNNYLNIQARSLMSVLNFHRVPGNASS
jgi:oxidase EvaA